MRFASFIWNGRRGLAVDAGGAKFVGRYSDDPRYPGDLHNLIRSGPAGLAAGYKQLVSGDAIDMSSVLRLPPIPNPEKIICVGLNYLDHTSESGFVQPDYPTLFTRVNSSLVGDGAPIIRPNVSEQLDYEGELVAVIGRGGRHIKKADALDHVAGTGAFGPVFVTADELPDGCKGLKLETRLNGMTVQSAPIASMVFDVASQIEIISAAITLAPGDLLVTGTPSGVGLARKPPLWMKPGDICEVEIEGIGVLRNPILDEVR